MSCRRRSRRAMGRPSPMTWRLVAIKSVRRRRSRCPVPRVCHPVPRMLTITTEGRTFCASSSTPGVSALSGGTGGPAARAGERPSIVRPTRDNSKRDMERSSRVSGERSEWATSIVRERPEKCQCRGSLRPNQTRCFLVYRVNRAGTVFECTRPLQGSWIMGRKWFLAGLGGGARRPGRVRLSVAPAFDCRTEQTRAATRLRSW